MRSFALYGAYSLDSKLFAEIVKTGTASEVTAVLVAKHIENEMPPRMPVSAPMLRNMFLPSKTTKINLFRSSPVGLETH